MPDNTTPPVQGPLTPKDIRAALDALAEENYRKFSARLLPPGEHVLGVRLPALRRLAKRIAAGPPSGTAPGARDHGDVRGGHAEGHGHRVRALLA